jgi:hypothetical protein
MAPPSGAFVRPTPLERLTASPTASLMDPKGNGRVLSGKALWWREPSAQRSE